MQRKKNKVERKQDWKASQSTRLCNSDECQQGPKNHNCLTTSCRKPTEHCLKTAPKLPEIYPKTAWNLPKNCLKSAEGLHIRRLPQNCLTTCQNQFTACYKNQLFPKSLQISPSKAVWKSLDALLINSCSWLYSMY